MLKLTRFSPLDGILLVNGLLGGRLLYGRISIKSNICCWMTISFESAIGRIDPWKESENDWRPNHNPTQTFRSIPNSIAAARPSSHGILNFVYLIHVHVHSSRTTWKCSPTCLWLDSSTVQTSSPRISLTQANLVEISHQPQASLKIYT